MTQTVQVPGVGTLQFPDGMSQPDMAAAIQKNFPQIHPPASPASPQSVEDKLSDVSPVRGVDETLMHVGSGMVATPVAGVAGLGAAALKELGLTDKEPADVVRAVQDAMTYQPRSTAGKVVSGAVEYPFQKLGEFADWLGNHAANATGSPAAGAAVNTAIQALPMILGRKGSAAKAPGAAEDAAAPAAAQNAAKDYVARNTSLDWDSLSGAIKDRLTQIAQDSNTLGMLDPKAVERQARLESLPVPVPATRGQLTRDPVQLRNEGNASATEAGRPIAEIHNAQNDALLKNLDLLKEEQGSTAASPEQVGQSVQDAARAKLAAQKQTVSDLYAKAKDAGELEAPVSPKPLLQTIAQSPDKTHFGWVQSWLNDMDVVKQTDSGTIIKKLKVGELEDLRQAAVARTKDGGTEAYYAGKVIDAIDQATSGAAGEAYQAARAARKAQGLEFEDQTGVARLVDDKSRTDRATALEDTWRKTVLGGSNEDLNAVKTSLLSGGTEATRAAGGKAWLDLRAQTLQYIKDEATRIVSPRSNGSPEVSTAGLQKAINAVGPQKLDTLFGPGTVNQLNKILQATKDVKTEPPTGFKGSPTFANALAFLEKSLGRVPIVGNVGLGTVKAVASLNKLGANSRTARTAQETPLDTAAASADQGLSNARIRELLRKNAGASTAALSNQQ